MKVIHLNFIFEYMLIFDSRLAKRTFSLSFRAKHYTKVLNLKHNGEASSLNFHAQYHMKSLNNTHELEAFSYAFPSLAS